MCKEAKNKQKRCSFLSQGKKRETRFFLGGEELFLANTNHGWQTYVNAAYVACGSNVAEAIWTCQNQPGGSWYSSSQISEAGNRTNRPHSNDQIDSKRKLLGGGTYYYDIPPNRWCPGKTYQLEKPRACRGEKGGVCKITEISAECSSQEGYGGAVSGWEFDVSSWLAISA